MEKIKEKIQLIITLDPNLKKELLDLLDTSKIEPTSDYQRGYKDALEQISHSLQLKEKLT